MKNSVWQLLSHTFHNKPDIMKSSLNQVISHGSHPADSQCGGFVRLNANQVFVPLLNESRQKPPVFWVKSDEGRVEITLTIPNPRPVSTGATGTPLVGGSFQRVRARSRCRGSSTGSVTSACALLAPHLWIPHASSPIHPSSPE